MTMAEHVSRSDGDIELRFLDFDRLQDLLNALLNDDRVVIGPTVQQQAIVYDEITSVSQLPEGWTDVQQPGSYRLERRADNARFGYVVGPHSWKRYLFPPLATVASADKVNGGWKLTTPTPEAPRVAFLGVRACELAAMEVQDRVFTGGMYTDPIYAARRSAAFIIAVNCTQAASTCFCTSMNTGPRCRRGFDLSLTETIDGYLIEIGSAAGSDLLSHVPTTAATAHQQARAAAAEQNAVQQISRTLDTTDIRNLLLGNLTHSQWEDVATRCLSCTNCTMVCPTCFCSTVTEVSDLTGEHIDRERQWDSCFNIDFSRMHAGTVRNTISSRYRQWLTHKLASWHDQFGQSGCVGCGRCITWCPPGIDLTEEVAAIRASSQLVPLQVPDAREDDQRMAGHTEAQQ